MVFIKKNIIDLTRISEKDYRKAEKLPVSILADNIRSMYNLGSLFRTADAFLIKELILAGISGCPPHPEISKTALGADHSVIWRHVDSALEEVKVLKKEGWKIVVLEQVHGSMSIADFKPIFKENYLLIVGNEVQGVNPEIVSLADFVLEIPQSGVKHSLNVSVSAGIAMWEFYKNLHSQYRGSI